MHNTVQTTSVSPYYILYSSHCSDTSQNSLSRLVAAFSLRSADYRHCSRNATKLFRTSKRNATTSSVLSKDLRLPYANKKPTQVSHNPPSLLHVPKPSARSLNCRVQTSVNAAANHRLHTLLLHNLATVWGLRLCHSAIHLLTC